MYGFLNHLDTGAVGQLLLEGISTEARQQKILQSFQALFRMPVWSKVEIPQSWTSDLVVPGQPDVTGLAGLSAPARAQAAKQGAHMWFKRVEPDEGRAHQRSQHNRYSAVTVVRQHINQLDITTQ